MEIDGKVMIVTGASSGIGEATARAAARAGARVVLAARRRERLEALARQIGADALPVPTDMRDPAQVRQLVDVARQQRGGVDVLVNNAGQGLHVPVEDITPEDLKAVMELNVYGALEPCKR
jgi:NADP-dependent 3-hydroxy acid dehydrogenase YdfG